MQDRKKLIRELYVGKQEHLMAYKRVNEKGKLTIIDGEAEEDENVVQWGFLGSVASV